MKTCGTTLRVLNEDGCYQDVEMYLTEDGKGVSLDLNRDNSDSPSLVTQTIPEMKAILKALTKFLETNS